MSLFAVSMSALRNPAPCSCPRHPVWEKLLCVMSGSEAVYRNIYFMLTRDVVKNSNVTGKPYEYVKQILDFLVNTNIH